MWHFSSEDTKNISMIENPTPLTFKKRSITKIHAGDKEGKEGMGGKKRVEAPKKLGTRNKAF